MTCCGNCPTTYHRGTGKIQCEMSGENHFFTNLYSALKPPANT